MKGKTFVLLRYIAKADKTLFEVPVEEQKEFISSLPAPTDEIERSFLQYRCQNFFSIWWKKWALNIAAALTAPFITLFIYLKGITPNSNKGFSIDAIGDVKGMEEIIPKELSSKYIIDNDLWMEGSYLSNRDLLFLFKMFMRHPFSPYFFMKNMLKVSKYSYMIKRYHPKAIIVHNEYSFTSSVLTAYCRKHGVLHINVMHGEKLYYIRDSFFIYDQCYVWSEYYKNLFISMKAEPNQFHIAVPPSLVVDCVKYHDERRYANYKYYLANYTEDELKQIIKSMEFAERQGKSVIYRPHPRYSNIHLLESYVGKSRIEYPSEVSILTSVASLEYAVGSYTTVLNQAYFSGKKTVVDDVTFIGQYRKVNERNYFLSTKGTLKLSELQSL